MMKKITIYMATLVAVCGAGLQAMGLPEEKKDENCNNVAQVVAPKMQIQSLQQLCAQSFGKKENTETTEQYLEHVFSGASDLADRYAAIVFQNAPGSVVDGLFKKYPEKTLGAVDKKMLEKALLATYLSPDKPLFNEALIKTFGFGQLLDHSVDLFSMMLDEKRTYLERIAIIELIEEFVTSQSYDPFAVVARIKREVDLGRIELKPVIVSLFDKMDNAESTTSHYELNYRILNLIVKVSDRKSNLSFLPAVRSIIKEELTKRNHSYMKFDIDNFNRANYTFYAE